MDDLPSAFWQGITEFNHRQYYACHDTLEALWMEANDPPKGLYQGILQIAVACYHLGNKNWQGAVTLLGEGISRLQPYEPSFVELDIEQLTHSSAVLLDYLQQHGPASTAALSPMVLGIEIAADLPPVAYPAQIQLPQITKTVFSAYPVALAQQSEPLNSG